ncbi:MAG TPA: chemotaxis protein CheB, partial [Anaerolineae bacterium]
MSQDEHNPETAAEKPDATSDIEVNTSVEPDAAAPEQPATDRRSGSSRRAGFPVVGIGASAGGLSALEAFFKALPAEPNYGMAFVIVQHLDPEHHSLLTDLIKRYTTMPVYKVSDGMAVEADKVYVIPPNRDLALVEGRLHLLERVARHGLRLPIDFFFRSLALDQADRAICVILSGTGSDGTLGLKAIKEVGGMAMVQSLESASYDGMPRSAIATGQVDYILPPEKMPGELAAYTQRAYVHRAQPVASPAARPGNSLQKIAALLRAHNGHDFTGYKEQTVQRRIERRMAVTQIDEIDDYVRFLQQSPSELETLFRDLLIGVTAFFRDPEA